MGLQKGKEKSKFPAVQQDPVTTAAIASDPRFSHITTDPKFRRLHRKQRKVTVDSRFQGMFSDPRFTLKYAVDKRGRPIQQTSTDHLKRYYEMKSDEEEEEDDDAADQSKAPEDDEAGSEKDEDASLDETERPGHKKKLKKKKKKKAINSALEPSNEINSVEDLEKMAASFLQDSSNVKDSDDVVTAEPADNDGDVTDDDNAGASEGATSENEEPSDEDEDKPLKLDLARGEGNLSSSDDDSSSEWELDEEDYAVHDWGELDRDAEEIEAATRRLAICNMDWDKIRAQDIFMLLNSFKPASGVVQSVKIYPSEFGKEKIKEEAEKGPLLEGVAEECDEDVGSGEEEEEDEDEMSPDAIERRKRVLERLRQYELNRLKYYYAIAECDSSETANAIYAECDGFEYESSATKMDLRFVPDDMVFDDTGTKDAATDIDSSGYAARQFVNSALQHVNAKISWDEPEIDRVEMVHRAFDEEFDEDKLGAQDYIASSSEASDAEDDESNNAMSNGQGSRKSADAAKKYKSLLGALSRDDNAVFKAPKGSTNKDDVESNEGEWFDDDSDVDDILVDGNDLHDADMEDSDDEWIGERRGPKKHSKDVPGKPSLQNNKNKSSKRKRDEGVGQNIDEQPDNDLALLLADDPNLAGPSIINQRHYNLKSLLAEAQVPTAKGKRLKKLKQRIDTDSNQDRPKLDQEGSGTLSAAGFSVNADDDRFGAIYTSGLFNIDPSDPAYKKTEGMNKLMQKKMKIRNKEGANINLNQHGKRKNGDTELADVDSDSPMEISSKPKQFDNLESINAEASTTALVNALKKKSVKRPRFRD